VWKGKKQGDQGTKEKKIKREGMSEGKDCIRPNIDMTVKVRRGGSRKNCTKKGARRSL